MGDDEPPVIAVYVEGDGSKSCYGVFPYAARESALEWAREQFEVLHEWPETTKGIELGEAYIIEDPSIHLGSIGTPELREAFLDGYFAGKGVTAPNVTDRNTARRRASEWIERQTTDDEREATENE